MNTTHAVAVLLTTPDGASVWLAIRSPLSKHYPGEWECPAGKVEQGELPEFTALRELYEETGILGDIAGAMTHRGSYLFQQGPEQQVDMGLFVYPTDLTPQHTEATKRSPWRLVSLEAALMVDLITPATKMLLNLQMKALHLLAKKEAGY